MARKKLSMLIVFLFLLPLSAAQSGNQFFQLFSGYVGVPITNGQQFILRVLAPFIFIFAISRFVAKGAFKQALDNSGLGGSVGKRAPTLIGLAVAGIMMILFGSVILWVIVIFAIMGALWFLIAGTGYAAKSSGASGAIKSAASRVSRSSSSGSDSGGVSADQVGEMLDDRIGQLKSELSSIDDEEQDEKQKEDQTEEEEEEGANPDQIEDEIESEEAELMDIVQKLETVEEQLDGLENDVDSIEQNELDEMQRNMSKLNDINHVEGQMKGTLNNFIQAAKSGRVGEDAMEEFADDMANWDRYVWELKEDIRHEKDIHEAIDKLLSDLQEMKDILDFAESDIHKAESLVNELEDEEKKAEALSQKYGAREIFEEIEKDESETEDIESEIRRQVVSRFQELNQRIDEEMERARQLKEYDDEEYGEIIDIVKDLDQEEGTLNSLISRFNDGPHDEYAEELDNIREHIDQIEEMARQLSSEHEA